MAEQQTFINLINRYLRQQPYLYEINYLPLKPNDSLLRVCHDGVILAYYVAWCCGQPCATKKPRNNFYKGDIINSLIQQARRAGAEFVNIGCSDLQTSFKLLLAFMTAVTKHGLKRMLRESSEKHAALLKELGISAENGDDLILKWFEMDKLSTIEDIGAKAILLKLRKTDCRFLSRKDCEEGNFETIAQCCRQMGIELGFSQDDFHDTEMHYMICALLAQKMITYPLVNDAYLQSVYGSDASAATIIAQQRVEIPRFTSAEEVASDERVAKYVLLGAALGRQMNDSQLDEWLAKRTAEKTPLGQAVDVLQYGGHTIQKAADFNRALADMKVHAPLLLKDLDNEVALRVCIKQLAESWASLVPPCVLSAQCAKIVGELPDLTSESVFQLAQRIFGSQNDPLAVLQAAGISWFTERIAAYNDEKANQAAVEAVLQSRTYVIADDLAAVRALYGVSRHEFSAVLEVAPEEAESKAYELGMCTIPGARTAFSEWADSIYYVKTQMPPQEFYASQLRDVEQDAASRFFDTLKIDPIVRQRFDCRSALLFPLVAERFLRWYAQDYADVLRQAPAVAAPVSLPEEVQAVFNFVSQRRGIHLTEIKTEGSPGAQYLAQIAAQLQIQLPETENAKSESAVWISALARSIVVHCARQGSKPGASEAADSENESISQKMQTYISTNRGPAFEDFIFADNAFVNQRFDAMVVHRECTGLPVESVFGELLACTPEQVCEKLNALSASDLFTEGYPNNETSLLAAKCVLLKAACLWDAGTTPEAVSDYICERKLPFAKLLQPTSVAAEQYANLAADAKLVLCSEMLLHFLIASRDEQYRKACYMLNRLGGRPLRVVKPEFQDLQRIKRVFVQQGFAARASQGKAAELLVYIHLACPGEAISMLPAPIKNQDVLVDICLQRLCEMKGQQKFCLAAIDAQAHFLLSVAFRAAHAPLPLENALETLQNAKYDTLLIRSREDTRALEALVAQVLAPNSRRKTQIMDVEKRRGYNCTWVEYVALRMDELSGQPPGAGFASQVVLGADFSTDLSAVFDFEDQRVKDLFVELHFEPEDALDARHKLGRPQLLAYFDISALTFEKVAQRLCERFQCFSMAEFVYTVQKNLQGAEYFTEATKRCQRHLHLLLSDVMKQKVLKTPPTTQTQIVQWVDRVSKFATRISNISSLEQVDYKVLGQLCGVILCQNCSYYNLRELEYMLELINVVKFYSLDQIANKDQFVVFQLLVELYYKYDKLRSQMVYSTRFLRNYVMMRTDSDAIEYDVVAKIAGCSPAELVGRLGLDIAYSEFDAKNQVFLTLYLIDRYLSGQTPPPAHFVKLLQRRYGIQAFMLQKITARDLAKIFVSCHPKYTTEFATQGNENETFAALQAIAKKEGIFMARGNDYEMSYIINNVICESRVSDEQFITKMGQPSQELIDRLTSKRMPPYIKREAVLAKEGMHWTMFKDLYYQE